MKNRQTPQTLYPMFTERKRSENVDLYRIEWVHTATQEEGHGSWLPYKSLIDMYCVVVEKYPYIRHSLVPYMITAEPQD